MDELSPAVVNPCLTGYSEASVFYCFLLPKTTAQEVAELLIQFLDVVLSHFWGLALEAKEVQKSTNFAEMEFCNGS